MWAYEYFKVVKFSAASSSLPPLNVMYFQVVQGVKDIPITYIQHLEGESKQY
jgi:hypothetical protein